MSTTLLRQRTVTGGGCGCGGDEIDGADIFGAGYVVDTASRAANKTGGGIVGGDESIGKSLYSGSATFGRVYSTIGAIIGVIIALILIFLGISRLRDPHTGKVTATVTTVDNCTSAIQQGSTTYTCVVAATYKVGGQSYTVKNLSVSRSTPLSKGSTITLWYDPSSPSDAVYETSPKTTGWALIGFGVLLGGITTGIAVMTYKSKGFAAGYGAVEGISMIGRSF